jgi:hypothetical protein
VCNLIRRIFIRDASHDGTHWILACARMTQLGLRPPCLTLLMKIVRCHGDTAKQPAVIGEFMCDEVYDSTFFLDIAFDTEQLRAEQFASLFFD